MSDTDQTPNDPQNDEVEVEATATTDHVDPGADPAQRKDKKPLIWGSLLLVVGAFWLVNSLGGLHRFGGNLLGLGAFIAIALVFYTFYDAAPERRWGLIIPIGLFASLAIIQAGSTLQLMPDFLEELILLLGLSASFVVIYLLEPKRVWSICVAAIMVAAAVMGLLDRLGASTLGEAILVWAGAACCLWGFLRTGKDGLIFPAGILVTFGIIHLTSSIGLSGRFGTSLFFLGMAATFGAYFLLGKPGKVKWAGPAAVILAGLAVFGLFSPLLRFAIPMALIGFGLWLILRARNGRESIAEPASPAEPARPADE